MASPPLEVVESDVGVDMVEVEVTVGTLLATEKTVNVKGAAGAVTLPFAAPDEPETAAVACAAAGL